MKYVQPYGVTDPDAPYINGDPSIGRMGSIPPAAAFEHPMRELVGVVTTNKLTPDENDLKQVAKAVRSQRSNYCDDTGSVNTLSVALDPPLAAYTIGLPLRVKVYATNTGPSTIDAGAGRVSIKKPNGAQTAAGDLQAAGLADLVFDGTNFQMINFGGAGGGPGDVFLVNIPYAVDSSPTANTVTANFSPAITSLSAGAIIMVKIANTNTAATNIVVNGLPPKPIHAQGGTPEWPFLPCDLVAGDVVVLTYDGTNFWVAANTIINLNVTFPVANNAQFAAIVVALGRKRILANASVLIKMGIGLWTPIATQHPNSDRITVAGTMKAARPTFNDFAKTGYSTAARAADSANNIAMLRSRYGTEIVLSTFDTGATHVGGGTITFQDILITGPNVYDQYLRSCGIGPSGGASVNLIGITCWGMACMAFWNTAGIMICSECFSVNGWWDGFSSNIGSQTSMFSCGSYGNARGGCNVNGLSQMYLQSRTGIPGVPDIPPSQVMCNAAWGVLSDASGNLITNKTTITNNAIDVQAQSLSLAYLTGGTIFGTTSPAPNVMGNNNSLINTANN
jgi:hypothetical protein